MILLRVLNLIFLLGLVACLAGAMAGLIVFAPFVGGAWFLTLLAIAGSEPSSPAPQPRTQPEREAAILSRPLADQTARPVTGRAGRAPA
jgi:hypothetical protein